MIRLRDNESVTFLFWYLIDVLAIYFKILLGLTQVNKFAQIAAEITVIENQDDLVEEDS